MYHPRLGKRKLNILVCLVSSRDLLVLEPLLLAGVLWSAEFSFLRADVAQHWILEGHDFHEHEKAELPHCLLCLSPGCVITGGLLRGEQAAVA